MPSSTRSPWPRGIPVGRTGPGGLGPALAARGAVSRLVVHHAGHLSDTGEPAGQVVVKALAMAGEFALDTVRAACRLKWSRAGAG